MELQGVQDVIKCRAFPLTLGGFTRGWYRQLKPRSISSFKDLTRSFVTQFLGGRDHKKPATHLLTVRQKSDESLRNYVVRFNSEALKVEGYSDDIALTAVMAGLKDEKFLWSLGKKKPATYTELLFRAQNYMSAGELLNARRTSDEGGRSKRSENKKRD